MKYITYIYMIGLFCCWGQTPAVAVDTIPKKYLIIKGDTITGQSIDLEEVVILPRLRLNSNEERRRYLILQRKTLKVYPYAKLAAERLETLNARMAGVKSKRQRKKYTRMVQKFVENEFADKLKKFTITEGQILIKLIHRQTGETAFDLIKELRSGWRAFWYNNTAKLFDMSLKIPFDPEVEEEDFLIEDILQRQFDKGNLEFQKSYKTFDLYTLNKIWKNKKGK
ncbi:DUF4294 domain-containing protein [Flavobacteriaceae bacterium]|uniref:DUF4294 domain-containing protein n=1 Tax=Formosa sp. Hel3_A1_48 TaxID=1336795 RepID=UPI00084E1C4A|nr:DUF4294 domain-containing protein [Formosa sp. Hel3_A1_48]MDC0949796.1 DUF4294 domain-containing protein [Flavobacteriaceae bacterium]